MTIRVVFAGTPEFSLPCLQQLIESPLTDVVGVVTQPDRRSGRGMRPTPSPIKEAAISADIDYITPEQLRDNSDALEWL
ncbi:MAG: methionyl-tRNA formyltransferase, partial [Mariprofundales bacterium]|nr:methionyl-tRNA formyltransferase [Mariprofundales bacterium]